MENNQNDQENVAEERGNSQNIISNNPSDQRPDEVEYAGATNSISKNQQESDEYQPAIDDTMIGYDGMKATWNWEMEM